MNSKDLWTHSSPMCAVKWKCSVWKQCTNKVIGKTRAPCQTEEHTPVHNTGKYNVSGGEMKHFCPHSSTIVPKDGRRRSMRMCAENEDLSHYLLTVPSVDLVKYSIQNHIYLVHSFILHMYYFSFQLWIEYISGNTIFL